MSDVTTQVDATQQRFKSLLDSSGLDPQSRQRLQIQLNDPNAKDYEFWKALDYRLPTDKNTVKSLLEIRKLRFPSQPKPEPALQAPTTEAPPSVDAIMRQPTPAPQGPKLTPMAKNPPPSALAVEPPPSATVQSVAEPEPVKTTPPVSTLKPGTTVPITIDPGLTVPPPSVASLPMNVPKPEETRVPVEDSWLSVLGKSIGQQAPYAVMEGIAGLGQALEDAVMSNFGLTPPNPEDSLFATASNEWRRLQQESAPQVEKDSLKSYVGQVAQSIAANAPSVIAAAASGGAAAIPLVVMSLQQGGQSYAEMRRKGIQPSVAIPAAAVSGGAEALGEVFPFGKLFSVVEPLAKRISPIAARRLMDITTPIGELLRQDRTLLQRMLGATVADIPGEELTSIIQAAVDKGTINPEMSMSDFGKILLDTVIVTSMQGPAMAALTHPFVREGQGQAAPPEVAPPPAQDMGTAQQVGPLPSEAEQIKTLQDMGVTPAPQVESSAPEPPPRVEELPAEPIVPQPEVAAPVEPALNPHEIARQVLGRDAVSYDDYQKAIETVESKLEAQGIDPVRLYFSDTFSRLNIEPTPGWTQMPTELEALYKGRDAIEKSETGEIQKDLESRLESLEPDAEKRNKLATQLLQSDLPPAQRRAFENDSWKDFGRIADVVAHHVAARNGDTLDDGVAFQIDATLGGTPDNPVIQLRFKQGSEFASGYSAPSLKTMEETQKWLEHLFPENTPKIPGISSVSPAPEPPPTVSPMLPALPKPPAFVEPLESKPTLQVVNGTIPTLSGRQIPTPPPIRVDTNRKAIADLKKHDQWIIDQAIAEATAKNDDFNLIQFQQMKAGKLSQSDKDGANVYLFGHANPEILAEQQGPPVVSESIEDRIKRLESENQALRGDEPPKASKKPEPTQKKRMMPVIGEPDLYNHIEELGGMKSPEKDLAGKVGAGIYDRYAESMLSGETRMLLRSNGLPPDELYSMLNSHFGYEFQNASEMFEAIQNMKEERQIRRGRIAEEVANRDFAEAAYLDKGRKKTQPSGEPINVDDLAIGAEFGMLKEKFTVVDITPEGDVVAEDGKRFPPQVLSAGEVIHPDKGSYVPAAADETVFEFGETKPFEEQESKSGVEKIGEYTFDQEDGAGQVPWNQDVEYRGFVKRVKPQWFLDLTPQRSKDSTKFLKQNKVFGSPFLEVEWDAEKKEWQVVGHEGRNRSHVLLEDQPDLKVPIHVFPRGMRSRDITDEMRNAPFRRQVVREKKPNAETKPAVAETKPPQAEMIPAITEAITSQKEPKQLLETPDIPKTIYRGWGRERKESVYLGEAQPILGKGKYFAINQKDAERFGPNTENLEFSPQNPLVINSGQEWKALTKKIGWELPNPFGINKEQLNRQITALNEYLKGSGYDSVIVLWDNNYKYDITPQGKNLKLLRAVFGIPQVFIPEFIENPAVSQRISEPPSVSSIADLSRAMADAGRGVKDEAANAIVAELGMKAAGPPKRMSGFEGSPLFGGGEDPQTDMFTAQQPIAEEFPVDENADPREPQEQSMQLQDDPLIPAPLPMPDTFALSPIDSPKIGAIEDIGKQKLSDYPGGVGFVADEWARLDKERSSAKIKEEYGQDNSSTAEAWRLQAATIVRAMAEEKNSSDPVVAALARDAERYLYFNHRAQKTQFGQFLKNHGIDLKSFGPDTTIFQLAGKIRDAMDDGPMDERTLNVESYRGTTGIIEDFLGDDPAEIHFREYEDHDLLSADSETAQWLLNDRTLGSFWPADLRSEKAAVLRSSADATPNKYREEIWRKLAQYISKSPDKPLIVLRLGRGLRATISTLRHERVHLAQSKISKNIKAVVGFDELMERNPSAIKVAEKLSEAYNFNHLALEIPAWIAGGDFERLGLTQDEAVDMYLDYVTLAVQKHGTKAARLMRALPQPIRRRISERQLQHPRESDKGLSEGRQEESPPSVDEPLEPIYQRDLGSEISADDKRRFERAGITWTGFAPESLADTFDVLTPGQVGRTSVKIDPAVNVEEAIDKIRRDMVSQEIEALEKSIPGIKVKYVATQDLGVQLKKPAGTMVAHRFEISVPGVEESFGLTTRSGQSVRDGVETKILSMPRVKSALESLHGVLPWQMTKKKFYDRYRQHSDIRGHDSKTDNLQSIIENGFTQSISVNVIPATEGKPFNVIESRYGTKKGVTTYAIPKESTIDTPNGRKIKKGHRPDPSEVVVPEYDYQPLHEALVRKAHREGKPVPPNVLAEYPDLSPPPPKVSVETNLDAETPDEAISIPEPQAKILEPTAPRIQIAAPEVGTPAFNTMTRSLDDVISTLATKLRVHIRVDKLPNPRVAGTFFPDSMAIVTKYWGDLDTTAHEIGHYLDHNWGVVREWAGKRARSPFDDELLINFAPYGSVQKTGPRSTLAYQRAEGVAEFIRAWAFNPEEAQRLAPKFYDYLIENKPLGLPGIGIPAPNIPKAVLSALQDYGKEVRALAAVDIKTRGLANQRTSVRQKPLMQRFNYWYKRHFKDIPMPLEKTPMDNIQNWFDFDQHMIERLITFGKAANPVAAARLALPTNDPDELFIQMRGGMARLAENVTSFGMIKARPDDITKPYQRAPGVEGGAWWLLGGNKDGSNLYNTESQAAWDQDIAMAQNYGIARRVAEKGEVLIKKGEDEIEGLIEEEVTKRLEEMGLHHPKGEDDDMDMEAYDEAVDEIRDAIDQDEELQAKFAKIRAKWYAKTAKISGTGIFENDYEAAKKTVAAYERDIEPDKMEAYRQGFERFNLWSDANLRYLVDMGRMSPETYALIKADNNDYYTMSRIITEGYADPANEGQRLFDPISETTLSSFSPTLLTAAEPIRFWHGSTRRIENPFLSLMAQTYAVLRESHRNHFLDTLTDLFVTDKKMYGLEHPEPMQLAYAMKQLPGPDSKQKSITVYKTIIDKDGLPMRGQPTHWWLNPDVRDDITKWSTYENAGAFLRIVQFITKSIPRFAFTQLNPTFPIYSAAREATQRAFVSEVDSKPTDIFKKYTFDQLQAAEISGMLQKPFDTSDRIKLEKRLAKLEKEVVKIAQYSQTPAGRKKIAELGVGSSEKNALMVTPYEGVSGAALRAVHAYQHWAQEWGELRNRMAENARAAEKARKEHPEWSAQDIALWAANRGKSLLDYQRQGAFMRPITRFIPFVGPNVGAKVKLLKTAMKSGGHGNRIAMASLYVILPAVLLHFLNKYRGDDEEARNQPFWRRMMHGAKIPGTERWLQFPIGFELGFLGALTHEILWEMEDQLKATNRHHFWQNVGHEFAQSFIPADDFLISGPVSGIAGSAMNYDWRFGMKPVPDEEKGKNPEFKDPQRGNRISRGLEKIVFTLAGAGWLADARAIDNILYNTFGGAYRIATSTADLGSKPKAFNNWVQSLTRSFETTTGGAPNVKWVRDKAFELGDENTAMMHEFKGMIKQARDAGTAEERNELARSVFVAAEQIRGVYEVIEPALIQLQAARNRTDDPIQQAELHYAKARVNRLRQFAMDSPNPVERERLLSAVKDAVNSAMPEYNVTPPGLLGHAREALKAYTDISQVDDPSTGTIAQGVSKLERAWIRDFVYDTQRNQLYLLPAKRDVIKMPNGVGSKAIYQFEKNIGSVPLQIKLIEIEWALESDPTRKEELRSMLDGARAEKISRRIASEAEIPPEDEIKRQLDEQQLELPPTVQFP